MAKEGDVAPEVADLVPEKGSLILSVTENGYGKRTPADEYRLTNRGGKGVINVKTTERNGKVVGISQVTEKSEVMLISQYGKDHPHRVEVHPRIGTFGARRTVAERGAGRPGRSGSRDSAGRTQREWDADSVDQSLIDCR